MLSILHLDNSGVNVRLHGATFTEDLAEESNSELKSAVADVAVYGFES